MTSRPVNNTVTPTQTQTTVAQGTFTQPANQNLYQQQPNLNAGNPQQSQFQAATQVSQLIPTVMQSNMSPSTPSRTSMVPSLHQIDSGPAPTTPKQQRFLERLKMHQSGLKVQQAPQVNYDSVQPLQETIFDPNKSINLLIDNPDNDI